MSVTENCLHVLHISTVVCSVPYEIRVFQIHTEKRKVRKRSEGQVPLVTRSRTDFNLVHDILENT